MRNTAIVVAFSAAFLGGCHDALAQAKSDVPEKLAEFTALIGAKKGVPKGAGDPAAITILDELAGKYAKMASDDQRRFETAVAGCLASPKITREPGKGDELFRRAVRALGATGRKGSKTLRAAYEGKVNRKFRGIAWVPFRGAILDQLGVGKDPGSIPLLLKQLRSAEADTLRMKAGAALGHFADSALAQRREIGKMLIREWINIDSNAHGTTDPALAQQRARSGKRLAAVSGAWNVTLCKLTKQKFNTPQEWQGFYNSPGWKANWDKKAVTSAGGKKSSLEKRRR